MVRWQWMENEKGMLGGYDLGAILVRCDFAVFSRTPSSLEGWHRGDGITNYYWIFKKSKEGEGRSLVVLWGSSLCEGQEGYQKRNVSGTLCPHFDRGSRDNHLTAPVNILLLLSTLGSVGAKRQYAWSLHYTILTFSLQKHALNKPLFFIRSLDWMFLL